VSTVFLDTVGLIALWDEADQWHPAAKQTYGDLRRSHFNGITTDAVLMECGNSSARRPYRSQVTILRQKLLKHGRLFTLTEEEWQAAWDAFDRGDAADAGIVDQASFVIMRRLGVRRAFTHDRHFTAAGFETLF
jgi:uncharacterized protein